MNAKDTILYQTGYLEGAVKQKQDTAANVFAYIIDHGEVIPEEQCLQILAKFLADKNYNKTLKSVKIITVTTDTKPCSMCETVKLNIYYREENKNFCVNCGRALSR